MHLDSPTPNDVINQMITLQQQLAQLETQIEALKPAFFDACMAQEASQFQHQQALIFRRLTPGKWDYPSNIIDQERRLNQLKQQFQQTHERLDARRSGQSNWPLNFRFFSNSLVKPHLQEGELAAITAPCSPMTRQLKTVMAMGALG